MPSPRIPNLSPESLSIFSSSSSTLSVMPSPSLYGELTVVVDGRRVDGGGAFSLSRARQLVDPPSSSSRADGFRS
jgi:hypothetical protein